MSHTIFGEMIRSEYLGRVMGLGFFVVITVGILKAGFVFVRIG